jgi:NADPH:quinone reductase-like Zn-dependent oxidoreductase
MKTYEIVSPDGIDTLRLADRPIPEPGPRQVQVRINASSINYRDLGTVSDPGPRGIPYPTIPNSDGAGEVTAVGDRVTRFKVGDRVMGTFMQNWIDGPMTPTAIGSALGGSVDRLLTEYAVLDEDGLVSTPSHLSDTEAATLPCAAVTASHNLVEVGGVKAGDTVLLLGTGGVSIFALQFAQMLGARVIHTSSSDEKRARLTELGAWQTINYADTPEWQDAVMDISEGRGVDHVVEVGGPGTMERSITATRIAGTIGVIGTLSQGSVNPMSFMRKGLRVQGIYVGHRNMFEDMNRAIAQHELRPVIDRTFAMEDARDAFHYMATGHHFGKIVIAL